MQGTVRKLGYVCDLINQTLCIYNFVLLSVLALRMAGTLKQHISTAGFVGRVPTDAPTREKTGWDDKHQIGTGCTNWFRMGMNFLQTGTIRYGMDAFRALQVLVPAH